jgi:hypothetical protein
MPKDRHNEPDPRAEHRGHALTKASATHLLRSGHIDRAQHRDIVKDAERGMKAARGKRERE